MEINQLKKISFKIILITGMLFSGIASAQNLSAEQTLLNAMAGQWHAVRGYVATQPESSCYTPQSFAFFLAGPNAASFSYSFSCSTGYQGQIQGKRSISPI